MYAFVVVAKTLTPDRRAVGADGIDVTTAAGEGQDEEEHRPDNDCDPHAVVDAQGLAVVQDILKHLRRTGRADVVGVVVAVGELRNAAGDGHRAKGGNEGRQFKLADKHAVDQTDQHTAHEGNQNSHQNAEAVADHGRGDHGAHCKHGADGQVDVAGDTHIALTDANQKERHDGAQQVHDTVKLDKVGIHDREHDHQDHDADEGGQDGCHAVDGHQALQRILFLTHFQYTPSLFSQTTALSPKRVA